MRFSLYTEIQLHPGKTPEALYGEVLEQIENSDRLGYDVYAGFTQSELYGKGLAAGLAIVLLGVLLDRITQAAARTRKFNGTVRGDKL